MDLQRHIPEYPRTYLFCSHKQNRLFGETRLNPATAFNIPNYHIYRQDRPHRSGFLLAGGTAVIVKETITRQKEIVQTKMDSTTILIKLVDKLTRISFIYRSPQFSLLLSKLLINGNRF